MSRSLADPPVRGLPMARRSPGLRSRSEADGLDAGSRVSSGHSVLGSRRGVRHGSRGREEHDGVRRSSSADGFRGASVHARAPRRLYESCCAARLRRPCGQRPHGLLGALARRTGRACGSDGTLRGDDAGDDGHAGGGARTVPVAKTLGAIDRLSGGRLLVAVGPGSSPDDYAAVGVDFSERWPRFDEAIGVLRALWRPDSAPFVGRFYSTEGLSLEPLPAQPADHRSG